MTEILHARRPAFAAAVGFVVYNSKISTAKMLCLIPVIGGICIASAKELDFAWGALIAASLANVASAFRGGENKCVAPRHRPMPAARRHGFLVSHECPPLLPPHFATSLHRRARP